MIKVDLSRAIKYVDSDKLFEAKALSLASFKKVQQQNGLGAEWLGWRTLLAEPNDALLEEIDHLAATIRKDAEVFIVVGIGGSYLGAKAVIDMLKPSFSSKGTQILYAGHQISGSQLSALVDYISMPKADGSTKSVYVNIISKSGTTLEPALAFRVLSAWMDKTYGEDEASKRIVATTSVSGGALNKTIEARNYKKFVLDDTVGGRFSVLTPVGLLPIAVAGIDIKSLFYAAVESYQALEKDPTAVIDYAALRYALHKSGTATDVISTFFPEMQAMGGWMQQLLGESEGKSGNGLFPAVLAYSTDLHSLGQLVQDGPRNLMETFLHIEKPVSKLKIPKLESDVDGLNYLAGKDFNEVGQKAFEGTREAHTEGGIPIITVSLPRLDEESAGSFLYFYELLTAVYVYNLGVNPFDQPGVEAYKKAMFSLLGKP